MVAYGAWPARHRPWTSPTWPPPRWTGASPPAAWLPSRTTMAPPTGPCWPAPTLCASSSAERSLVMERRSGRPRRPALPPDSLAFALHHAAGLVAVVRSGRNLSDAFAELWEIHRDWTAAQRGAIRDLAYTCLRDFGCGSAKLAPLLAKPAPEPIHSLLLVAVSRLAVEPGAAHTIVDQAVRAAEVGAAGLKGLVNGVLRNLLRQTPWEPGGDEARYRQIGRASCRERVWI